LADRICYESGMLDRLFDLSAKRTRVRTEVLAGATTFVTLSYILMVQPTILAAAGMDRDAVFVATCVASAVATLLMAFLANHPIALAPGMGINVFFAFVACGALGFTWQQALGAVLISGLAFIALSFLGIREHIMAAIPPGLRRGIAAGIGLLISFVGLQYAGVVVDNPGFLVGLGDLGSRPVLVALVGTVVAAVLVARRVSAALLVAMLVSVVLELVLGLVRFEGVFAQPPSIAPTLLAADPLGAIRHSGILSLVFAFLFIDLFDTIGTLLGVGEQADLLEEGKLPRARGALLADACGTVVGALLGTSTVTSYVESAAGAQAGGRTGLASVVTALLFILALFFYPVIGLVGGGVELESGATLYPAIAPALLMVGAFMAGQAGKLNWRDPVESLPAFLTMIIMPFTGNITEGIAFGTIAFSAVSLATGRGREGHWIIHLLAAIFVARYVFLAS
jgi:AGZA family xanthine/uracil permease-like MFS transporter